mmetsp:Transcript_20465/g.34919  ORF Transcript_20465/g.34919 Transcript_20465/m.34919 type:complete len:189 (+) Transcript_20465:47-613(+)
MADEELLSLVAETASGKLLFTTLKDEGRLHEIFIFFCHERHAQENILVWDEIQEWKKNPEKDVAIKIFEKYIKEGCDSQVNVNYGTWKRLESLLEGDDAVEEFTGKEFKYVEEEVFQLMMVSLIQPFKIQFPIILEDFKNKDDDSKKKKDKHSDAFLPGEGNDEYEEGEDGEETLLQMFYRLFFFWRS